MAALNLQIPSFSSVTDVDVARSSQQRRAYEAGRREWPTVHITPSQFAGHLDRLAPRESLPTYVTAVYLCAGCALGVPEACAVLEDQFIQPLRHMLRRFLQNDDAIEDTMCTIRNRLLVGPTASIARYRGEGPLTAWIRVTALNAARDLHRTRSVESRGVRRLAATREQAAPRGWTDNACAVNGCVDDCEAKLRSTVVALPQAARQLLYYHFVLGLTIDELGRLHGVDRSTAARRIQRALLGIQTLVKCDGTGLEDLDADQVDEVIQRLDERIDVRHLMLLSPLPRAALP